MIPAAELNHTDWRWIIRLLGVPGLWPFAAVVSELGLDAALECCRDDPTPALPALTRGGWTAGELPDHELIDAALFGCVVRSRRRNAGHGALPLLEVARHLGVPLEAVHAALRALDGYGLGSKVLVA